MLVLTRRANQAIRVGSNVEIKVVRIEGDRVVLGIVAPRHIAVVRSELIDEVGGEVREAADARARLRVMIAPLHSGTGADQPDTDGSDGPDGSGVA
jgi:carbon storage regulator